MPELPTFLADVFTPAFARRAVVAAIDDLSSSFLVARFAGEDLVGARYVAGQEVELRVSERSFRHYTPVAFDTKCGTMDIAFFLHGDGPGCRWARGLEPGAAVRVFGPGGSFGLQRAARHVFLGDETALGLFSALAAEVPDAWVAAIEGSNEAHGWPAAFRLPGSFVPRAAERGDALLAWLENAALRPDERTCFYLAGHAASIVRLRTQLRQLGWHRSRIRTKAYWADGKRGL